MPQFALHQASRLARVGWVGIRLALLAMLTILEPLVRWLLGGAALLLTLNALFYALAGPAHHAPLAGMLGLALLLIVLLAGYYALARALQR